MNSPIKKLLFSLLAGLFAVSVSSAQDSTNAPVILSAEDVVFQVVEEMPRYRGGSTAMQRFLSKKIQYPEVALKSNVHGTVFVSFVVDKAGSLSEVKAISHLGHGCDEEAVRVVSLMPPWIPGRHNGCPVSVRYSIPVRFTLPD
jgi:protein TonB